MPLWSTLTTSLKRPGYGLSCGAMSKTSRIGSSWLNAESSGWRIGVTAKAGACALNFTRPTI